MNEPERSVAVKLLAIGAAHLDRRGRCAVPYSPAASNPGTMRETVGGAAFNAAGAARALGAEVRLVSARGGDSSGGVVTQALRDLDIADMATVWLDRPTPTYTAILDHRGDLVAGLADMALYDLMQPRIFRRRHIREALADADAVLVDANLPEATLIRLAAQARAPVFAIAVSPAKVPRLSGALDRLAAIFLSRAEAAALVEADDNTPMTAVVERLARIGCRCAVVTDGSRAAAILENGRVFWQAPPFVASLRDVTGAGDTLAGVAAIGRARGVPFVEAARLGMAAASLHVSEDRRPGDFTAAALRAIAAAMPAPTNERPPEPPDPA